jgi:RNA polymerase sigma-70 factor (ECF subfamily)
MSASFEEQFECIYADERGRILATLIGLLHDFDLAEEMMQEAFAAALVQWRSSGVPQNPRAWIVSAARHKALDRLRRDTAFQAKFPELRRLAEQQENPPVFPSEEPIADDRLRLIFTCCHPALATEAQVALTLRTLCGLTTEEIARAFLVNQQTMAQRLVRVQRKITDAGIPYSVPETDQLPARVDAVLVTIYLIFTAGYSATSGQNLLKKDLCAEAIRLARVLAGLLPDRGEIAALLALMLFHDSRRLTRTDSAGDIVLLDAQDRSLWNRAQIQEATDLLETALQRGAGSSRYGIEACISALHATAARHEDTDWPQIAALYAELKRVAPSPVVELNAAVAVAMVEGPEAGLALLGELESSGQLEHYHLLPAAQARLLDKLGRWESAAARYREALALARNEPERRFLQMRLTHVNSLASPDAECIK